MKKEKILELAKGFRGRAKNCIRIASLRVEKALQHAYRDRRNKKRDMRSLWIMRINAGARLYGLKYHQFVFGLSKENIQLNRKVLSDIAMHEPYSFKCLVDIKDLGGSMGATLSEVYQKARHSLLVVRDGVEKLERAESSSSLGSSSSSNVTSASSSPRDVSDLSMFVKREIGQLENYCAELERLWRAQLPKAQRDMWKRKVEQLQEEIDILKSDVEKVMGRHRKRQIEAQERQELLQRSNGDAARILQVYDEEANALQSVNRSATMVEEAYATGVAILSKYAEQREHLKRAHRKALDILNTVGLSNSVLRVIERRLRMDKWIAYGGMIIVCIVVIAFWFWMH